MSQKSLSGYNYDCLWSSNFSFFFLLELEPSGWDVFEGVEDGDKVGEGFPGAVVGIDDHAEVTEVVLKGDGERLCLDEGGFFEIVFVE